MILLIVGVLQLLMSRALNGDKHAWHGESREAKS